MQPLNVGGREILTETCSCHERKYDAVHPDDSVLGIIWEADVGSQAVEY